MIQYQVNFRKNSKVSKNRRQLADANFVQSLIIGIVALGLVGGSLSSKPVQAQEPAAEQHRLFMPALSISTADSLNLSQSDGEPADDGLPVDDSEPVEDTLLNSAATGWKADMETADLSQWRWDSNSIAESDSGLCMRPASGITDEQAFSGNYSLKMVIDSTNDAGCRQFRKPEPASGNPYYYSAWYYIPHQTYVGTFWNIMQFKSKLNSKSGLFWKIEIRNASDGNMYAMLVWKGPIAGPNADDGITTKKYTQTLAALPVGKWFKLEVYLKQSEQFDGQISVWQDGVQLFNVENVRTRFPGGYQNWSVNNYGKGLLPNPATLYIDDVTISPTRTSP